MIDRLKPFVLAAVVVVCSLGLTAPSLAASQDELVVAMEAETSSMDPMKAWVTYGLVVSRLMYDSPINFGPNGELTPGLAEKWTAVDDLTWRFKLRPGVKFHNGYRLSAEDVKFTVERILDPANKCRFRTRYGNIDKVVVIDDLTFDIVTKKPDPLLPNRVAFFIRVVSKKWIEENGADALHKQAMGTGPFKMVSWKRKDRLVLEANTGHYLNPPKIKKLIIRPIPEVASRMAELRAGGVHIAVNIPPFAIPVLDKDPGAQVQTVMASRTMFMVMNTLIVPELQNKLVRQALNYAVDKDAIVKGIMSGLGNPVGLPAPPQISGVDKSIKPYPYDPDKARALLKEAGYPDGFALNLYSPSGRYPMDKEVVQAVADQLSKVGVKTKVNVLETQKYFRRFVKHDIAGLMLIGFGYAYADQDSMANFFLKKAAYCHYNNPDLENLIPEMRSTLDRTARYATAHKIQKIIHQECPMLFLYNLKNVYGVSTRVRGFKARSDDNLDLTDVTLTK